MRKPRVAPVSTDRIGPDTTLTAIGAPPADPHAACLDLDDVPTVQWKLQVLDLALDGLIHGPRGLETEDLDPLQGLVHELIDLAQTREYRHLTGAPGDGGHA